MAKTPKTTPDVISPTEQFADVREGSPEDYTPTPEEARAMFAENPGLWAVMTTEGNKLRGEC